jgi:hypothetical protein
MNLDVVIDYKDEIDNFIIKKKNKKKDLPILTCPIIYIGITSHLAELWKKTRSLIKVNNIHLKKCLKNWKKKRGNRWVESNWPTKIKYNWKIDFKVTVAKKTNKITK